MLKAAEPRRKTPLSEKNAVTGRVVLESKLKYLSGLQRKHALENPGEKTILKYHTNIARNYSSLDIPQVSSSSIESQNDFSQKESGHFSSTTKGRNIIYPSCRQTYDCTYIDKQDFKIPPELLESVHESLLCTYGNLNPTSSVTETSNVAKQKISLGHSVKIFGVSGELCLPSNSNNQYKPEMRQSNFTDADLDCMFQYPKSYTSSRRSNRTSRNKLPQPPNGHTVSLRNQSWPINFASRPSSAKVIVKPSSSPRMPTDLNNSFLPQHVLGTRQLEAQHFSLSAPSKTVSIPTTKMMTVDNILQDIAITNSTPRAKMLVASNAILPNNHATSNPNEAKGIKSNGKETGKNWNEYFMDSCSSNTILSSPNPSCQSLPNGNITVRNRFQAQNDSINYRLGSAGRKISSRKQSTPRPLDNSPRVNHSSEVNLVLTSSFINSETSNPNTGQQTVGHVNHRNIDGKTCEAVSQMSRHFREFSFVNNKKSEYRIPSPMKKKSKNHPNQFSLKTSDHHRSGQPYDALCEEKPISLLCSKQESEGCGSESNSSFASSKSNETLDGSEEQDALTFVQEEAAIGNISDELTEEMIDGSSCCQEESEFDIDCTDHTAIDCLEDDDVSEAAESEYSVCSGASRSSNICNTDSDIKVQEESLLVKPALIPSLFSNCPPVINFGTKHEKVEPLPQEVRKLLRWKMSSITPIVVRHTVARSGFKPSKKNHDWLGYFGKHMKASGFRSLREYQKINHFPGSFQVGRKDRLWRNLSRMQVRFGKKEFGFIPQSFILPWDKKLLKSAWEEVGTKQKYILKPPASARGIGIRIIHKWNQIPTRKPVLIQKYISRPLLLNGCKFDLRLYVYVTSFDPLRIYLFDDGLVRFATCRSLKALWRYLQERGTNTDKLWEQMKDICIKTIISVEQYTNSLVKANCRRRSCCHELFGFDIMLDDRMRPWILEVNISPSLHSNSPLDVSIKGQMVSDMLNLAGFQLPDKKLINANAPNSNNSIPSLLAAASFSQDKRKQSQEITLDTRSKHTYFAQHYKQLPENELMSMMLDVLTINDIQMLVESEEENSRQGHFERIFPGGIETKKYFSYFEQPRYYNVLHYLWEVKYQHQRQKGIALLESYCRHGLHRPGTLMSNMHSIPSEHIWTFPMQFKSPRADSKLLFSPTKATSSASLPHSSNSDTHAAEIVTSNRRGSSNRSNH